MTKLLLTIALVALCGCAPPTDIAAVEDALAVAEMTDEQRAEHERSEAFKLGYRDAKADRRLAVAAVPEHLQEAYEDGYAKAVSDMEAAEIAADIATDVAIDLLLGI